MIKKGQVAMEFLFFVGISIFILMIYMGISFNYIDIISKKGEIIEAQNLADTLKNEINLAGRVENGYIREITLPIKINSLDYTAKVESRTVVVNFEGSDFISLLATDVDVSIIPNNILDPSNTYLLKKNNDVVSLELKVE